MQQLTGRADTTTARTLESSTGPDAEAITGVQNCAHEPIHPECSATVTLHITHNQVIATAMLNMGGHKVAQRVFERRKGSRPGWVLVKGREEFADEGHWISTELAKLADRLPFPFEVANMLPGRKATPAAVAHAAQEVSHG
jgi:hypothetical protein